MQVIKSILFFSLLFSKIAFGQGYDKSIDSLIFVKTTKPLNGIILISENGKIKYLKSYGYSDIDKKVPLKLIDQFVIGSISKQFTAVLILRELDKGKIDLFTPIHKYLPELKQSWADTVTIQSFVDSHARNYTN